MPTRKKKRKKRIITPSEVEDSESEEPERDELPIRKKKRKQQVTQSQVQARESEEPEREEVPIRRDTRRETSEDRSQDQETPMRETEETPEVIS